MINIVVKRPALSPTFKWQSFSLAPTWGDYKAILNIKTQEMINGELPLKQLKLVQAWAIIHEIELENNFISLNSENPTWQKIDPLK